MSKTPSISYRVNFEKVYHVKPYRFRTDSGQSVPIEVLCSKERYLPTLPVIGYTYTDRVWSETVESVNVNFLGRHDEFIVTAFCRKESLEAESMEDLQRVLNQEVPRWGHVYVRAGTQSLLGDWLKGKEFSYAKVCALLSDFEFSSLSDSWYDLNGRDDLYHFLYLYRELAKEMDVLQTLNKDHAKLETLARKVLAFMETTKAKRTSILSWLSSKS